MFSLGDVMIDETAEAVANLLEGFRDSEIPDVTASRVLDWVEAIGGISPWLDDRSALVLVEALHDALSVGYWSSQRTIDRISQLDPTLLWPDAPVLLSANWRWLNLQGPESSQTALHGLFEALVPSPMGDGQHFFYLDDGLFSGGTVSHEVERWVETERPTGARLLIAHLVGHAGRYEGTRQELERVTRRHNVDVRMIAATQIAEPDFHLGLESSRQAPTRYGLCLKPTRALYESSDVCQRHWQRFEWHHRGYAFLEDDVAITCERVFRSPEHRRTLTLAMLEVGCKIMLWTKDPNPWMRPLGYCNDNSFGVGAMMATFHNSPNTAPLALWWGDPSKGAPLARWDPLLPRRPDPRNRW